MRLHRQDPPGAPSASHYNRVGQAPDWHPHTALNHLQMQDCCCSVTKSCPTLCDSINCSMPGFPVLHHLWEFAQIHVHCDGDTMVISLLLLPSISPSIGALGSFPKIQDGHWLIHNKENPHLHLRVLAPSKEIYMGKEVKITRSPGKQGVKTRSVLFWHHLLPMESNLVRGKGSVWAQSWTGLGANPEATIFSDSDLGQIC